MRSALRALTFAAAVSLSLSTTTMATAEDRGGGFGNDGGSDESADGGTHGKALTATATQVRITTNTAPSNGHKLTPAADNWSPPQCWYEPVATPKQLKEATRNIEPDGDYVPVTPRLSWGEDLMQKKYGKKSELSKWGNYNISRQGKGMWHRGANNPNQVDDWDVDNICDDTMFWLPRGAPPPNDQIISPTILAGYAYSETRVPDTEVEMNPSGKSTVNLPTWIWAEISKYEPVSVTAELPSTDLWATTTATPTSLHLDPGTEDAVVHPSSGECPINADGSIGKPYSKGNSDNTPPCGITYKRATTNTGPHQLTATITWEISWEGTGGAGGNLPDGTFESTQNITVQEIQSIVR